MIDEYWRSRNNVARRTADQDHRIINESHYTHWLYRNAPSLVFLPSNPYTKRCTIASFEFLSSPNRAGLSPHTPTRDNGVVWRRCAGHGQRKGLLPLPPAARQRADDGRREHRVLRSVRQNRHRQRKLQPSSADRPRFPNLKNKNRAAHPHAPTPLGMRPDFFWPWCAARERAARQRRGACLSVFEFMMSSLPRGFRRLVRPQRPSRAARA